jgi:tagatose-6-phosphate ketose/aldose isomerase
MPATSHNGSRFLGIAEPDLAASGAIWTAREIEQQPRLLEQTHELVAKQRNALDEFVSAVTGNPAARVVLTGAGTSAYIGECLAPALDRQLSARVDAVATTDIVSAPDLYLDPDQPLLLVSLGRSGNSPESVAAVRLAESIVRDVRHLVITCNPDGQLGRIDVARRYTLRLPAETHDVSFAMTSSFSCMMYAAHAVLAGRDHPGAGIDVIARTTAQVIAGTRTELQEMARQGYERVVYLGSGTLTGLAREAALKIGELSDGAIATCYDSPLGFRHGPKTFVTDRTLVTVFVSNHPLTCRYDQDLVDELRNDACAGRVVEVSARPRPGLTRDTLAVPGMEHATDTGLLYPYVAIAQIYAFMCSRELKLTPDSPNRTGTVNRVVQGVRLHSPPGL